jgi:N-acetylmuramoyl-L-alanine amidase
MSDKIEQAKELISNALDILDAIPNEAIPESVDKSITVAIVVGHSDNSRGASNPVSGMSEHPFNHKVAKDIAAALNNDESHNVNGIIVLRKTGLGDLIKEVNATGANLCLSLHCNAFNRTASGCETLYYHTSKKSKEFAEVVQFELIELMGNADRGIKPKSSEERGGWILRETNMPCVIAEPFFIDETKDYKLGMEYREDGQLAAAYTRAVLSMVEKL